MDTQITEVGYIYLDKLEINKPKVNFHSGISSDQVGPGHYPYKDCFILNK